MRKWILSAMLLLLAMIVLLVSGARGETQTWRAMECEVPALQLLREVLHDSGEIFRDVGRSEARPVVLGETRTLSFVPNRCGHYSIKLAWPRGIDIEFRWREAKGHLQCSGAPHSIKSNFERGRLGNFYSWDVGYGLGSVHVDSRDALGQEVRCEVVFDDAEPVLLERMRRADTFLSVSLVSSK
jgi:hypothetical protein